MSQVKASDYKDLDVSPKSPLGTINMVMVLVAKHLRDENVMNATEMKEFISNVFNDAVDVTLGKKDITFERMDS